MVTGIGLVANLIAVPWMGVVVMPITMLASVVTFVWSGLAGTLLWPAAAWSVEFMLRAARALASTTTSFRLHAAPSMIEVSLIYVTMLIMVYWRRVPRRRLLFLAAIVPLAVDVGWWQIGPLMTDKLEMTMLDVGQGDAMLVRFPGGKNWLVDGGGKHGSAFDVGKNVVVPALLRRGIHRVDRLVLTHPHHDHYRGLAAVAEYFGPDVMWTNGFEPPEEEQGEWQEFEDRLQAAGVVSKAVGESEAAIELSGIKIEILYPYRALPEDIEPNDTSLVIKLTYNDVSVLLTGDLEKRGEELLLANGDDLSATILKVGHHGSDTSSSKEFIEAVRPKIALISVGQLNEYGMPDEVVLDRLEKIGARIYRTDLHGAITITTDGRDLSVVTVVGDE